jgi:hypothetical protein
VRRFLGEVAATQLVAPARVFQRLRRDVALGRQRVELFERGLRGVQARALLDLLGLARVGGREAAHHRRQRQPLADERHEDRPSARTTLGDTSQWRYGGV